MEKTQALALICGKPAYLLEAQAGAQTLIARREDGALSVTDRTKLLDEARLLYEHEEKQAERLEGKGA